MSDLWPPIFVKGADAVWHHAIVTYCDGAGVTTACGVMTGGLVVSVAPHVNPRAGDAVKALRELRSEVGERVELCEACVPKEMR